MFIFAEHEGIWVVHSVVTLTKAFCSVLNCLLSSFVRLSNRQDLLRSTAGLAILDLLLWKVSAVADWPTLWCLHILIVNMLFVYGLHIQLHMVTNFTLRYFSTIITQKNRDGNLHLVIQQVAELMLL